MSWGRSVQVSALGRAGRGGKGRTDTSADTQSLHCSTGTCRAPRRARGTGNLQSSDTVQKAKQVGEKFGDGTSPMTQFKSPNELGKNLGRGCLSDDTFQKSKWAQLLALYWVPEGRWQPCCTSHGTVHPGQLPALAVRPSNPHTELLRKGKLWDFMEGTAGLWCHERAKLSMMKPPRHVLVHQMSNLN